MKKQFIIIVIVTAAFILIRNLFWVSEVHKYHTGPYFNNFTTHDYNDISPSAGDGLINHAKDELNNVQYTTISSNQGITIHMKSTPSLLLTQIEKSSPEIDLKKFQSLSSNLELLNLSNVRIVETPSNASFIDRVEIFCSTIDKESQAILSDRGLKSWKDVIKPDKLKVLWGRDDDFIGKLISQKKFRFIILPWIKSNDNGVNVILKDYYGWTASDPLCEWIRTPRFTKAHYDAVYNRSCKENLESSRKPKMLEHMYFHSKPINQLHYWPEDGLQYPSHFYSKYPSVSLYLTIIQDGIVNLVGDVISEGVKIVPYTCSHDNIPTIPNEYRASPIYKEVFVITQFWGESYFHRMTEVMPRLAPYLSFLRKNPNIKIHALRDKGTTYEIMKLLKLNPERIVSGVIRAKVIYLPQGIPCGFPQVQSLQLLSNHLRNSTNDKESFRNARNVSTIRNKLVMIKRSGTRRFLHDQEINFLLGNFSLKHGLDFHIFSDLAIPAFKETISIFNSALVVVAPHGAGLSNVIFSEPGTLVLEGVCNPPHVNMCYQFVSHILGLRYHAIPSLSGCETFINIIPQDLLEVLEQFFTSKILVSSEL